MYLSIQLFSCIYFFVQQNFFIIISLILFIRNEVIFGQSGGKDAPRSIIINISS